MENKSEVAKALYGLTEKLEMTNHHLARIAAMLAFDEGPIGDRNLTGPERIASELSNIGAVLDEISTAIATKDS